MESQSLFPKELSLKPLTKPSGAIKLKDETLWLSSEAGACQGSQGTQRASLLSALRKAWFTRTKRRDAGGYM